jgi:hypothetical protein
VSPAPRPSDVFHTAICDLLNIEYRILQGALQGGVAVSEAGGLGVLPDAVRQAERLPALVKR